MIRKPVEMKTETREKMRGGEGSVTFQHYFEKDEFGASVRLCAKLILPPGASIGTHQHEGEDEVYIVAKGSGILDDGKTKTRISSGDAVLTGRGDSHAVMNDGKEPLEIIAVIATYPAAQK